MANARYPAARRAAMLIARRLRRWQIEPDHPGPSNLDQVAVLRRVLEEAGIHCEDSRELEDLAAFLISSPRGTEMVLSARLSDSERLLAYAHLLAHVLISGQRSGLFARFEYHAGREPTHLTMQERREEMVARSLARAILAGRLEGAPRYLYGPMALPSPRNGVRRAAAQVLLVVLHHASRALYWRSPSYQQLRGLPAIAGLVTRLQSFLGEAEPIAA
ncbi:MAG: hypothetical protein HY690_13275 [Chloroflexi bacterium]|nr:hypothetical protein [Chloroflexota bacterium]